ncbi:MAG: hypothetical protein IPK60_24170 [Sandaracinaceae bacterium]|nr:hypothetical protein [Sandaracinaceae bacterium]
MRFVALLSLLGLCGCYESREWKYDDAAVPSDARPLRDGSFPAADLSCELSDCDELINSRVGLVAIDGMPCCFESQCTPAMPPRRAWVVSCHNGIVRSFEVFP